MALQKRRSTDWLWGQGPSAQDSHNQSPTKQGLLQTTGGAPSSYFLSGVSGGFPHDSTFLLSLSHCMQNIVMKDDLESHIKRSLKKLTLRMLVCKTSLIVSCHFKFNCTHHRLILALLNIQLLVYICDLSPKLLILSLLHLLDYLIFSAMPK